MCSRFFPVFPDSGQRFHVLCCTSFSTASKALPARFTENSASLLISFCSSSASLAFAVPSSYGPFAIKILQTTMPISVFVWTYSSNCAGFGDVYDLLPLQVDSTMLQIVDVAKDLVSGVLLSVFLYLQGDKIG